HRSHRPSSSARPTATPTPTARPTRRWGQIRTASTSSNPVATTCANPRTTQTGIASTPSSARAGFASARAPDAPPPTAASAEVNVMPGVFLLVAKLKIAVLVLGAGVEPDLADNLTEILIARVAKLGGYEMAGKEEFRGKLGVEDERKALACMEDHACVGRAGAALGVTRVLAGTVGKRDKDYIFSLSLLNLESGKTENQTFKLVPGGVQELIEVVSQSATKIFEKRPDPGNVKVAATMRGARVYVDD